MGLSITRRARLALVAIAAVALPALVPAALTHASARVADGTMGKIAGIGIAPPGQPQMITNSELGRVRSNGLNTVSIDVWWDVDAATQSHVVPGELTMPDATLVSTIQRSRAAGLKTVVTPKVWCPGCRRSWSGVLKPMDVNGFFRDYRNMVNHYAK